MAAGAKTLISANNEFTSGVYKALQIDWSERNLMFSPFSLHAVLGMSAQGARGETKYQLLRKLRIRSHNDKAVGSMYKSAMGGFSKASSSDEKTFELHEANGVFVQNGFNLNPKFADNLETYFDADVEQLDFRSDESRVEAVEVMKTWVEAKTDGKIKNLVGIDVFDKRPRMVLLNTIYFKSVWEYPFDASKTTKYDFHVDAMTTVKVDMMHHREGRFPFANLPELDARAIALPFKGDRLRMVLILPNSPAGISKIQRSIGTILTGRLPLKTEIITLFSIPKFKFEVTTENMGEIVFPLMGITSMMISEEADFSGVPAGKPERLFVSKVLQKTFIDVNEGGMEAKATTSTMLSAWKPYTGEGQVRFVPFVVGQPFYFQIVDHANNDLVLFAGHCRDPTKTVSVN